MLFDKCSQITFSLIAIFLPFFGKMVTADEMDLYSTKQATSDLGWEPYTSSDVDGTGWEEVSGGDGNTVIRSYQVCHTDQPDVENWIRSPFISARDVNEIHLEVQFSITRCFTHDTSSRKNNKCKETFNIFYYPVDTDVASSTFPPWHERPYLKLDTIAANNINKINTRLFKFGPLSRNGFYIAVQDQGACMSLISLRAFYYYCPETVVSLVAYPRTISAVGSATLVSVSGHCAPNSVQVDHSEPLYWCSSNGQWQIQTGKCDCDVGFEANSNQTKCTACLQGHYKLHPGSGPCLSCPANSGPSKDGPSSIVTQVDKMPAPKEQCPCFQGYARAPDEEQSTPCSNPPSRPISLVLAKSNATAALLRWKAPEDDGGRDDLFYSFTCEASSASVTPPDWSACSSDVRVTPSSDGRHFETWAQFGNLSPYTDYRVLVFAQNGAFSSLFDRRNVCNNVSINFQTDQSAPSAVDSIRVTDRSSSSFTLTWSKPSHPNGVILGYEIKIVYSSKRRSFKKVNTTSIAVTNLPKDNQFEIQIRAQTSVGFGPYSSPHTASTISKSDFDSMKNEAGVPDVVLIICISAGGILFLLVVVFTIRYCKTGRLLCLRASRRPRKPSHRLNGSCHPDPLLQERLIVDLPPLNKRIYVDYADPEVAITRIGVEVNPNNIKLEEKIGEGEFAEVWMGKMILSDRIADVAVKRLKQGALRKDEVNFLREASTMAQFKHPNVISLIGVVTKSSPVTIVTEHMENGSLDRFLQKHVNKLSMLQLLKMLKGIASGMSYLSSINFIHRDLAARNILVDSDLVCKVSDFGLSRILENNPHATYSTQGGKIAIRWTALESIVYREFTSASDVWSFGIVMWEVMSYGEKPYWEMNNEDVVTNIQSGMRLPSPVDCPEVLHDLMLRCWLTDPAGRPTFNNLYQDLDNFMRQPSLLTTVGSSHTLTVEEAARILATPNLGRAVDSGEVDTVDKWLELQRLSKYADQFKERGVDDLEKVSHLTINDLKAMGIEVTLHISKLESGIRTLKRHLSVCISDSPSTSRAGSSSSRGACHPVEVEESVLI